MTAIGPISPVRCFALLYWSIAALLLSHFDKRAMSARDTNCRSPSKSCDIVTLNGLAIELSSDTRIFNLRKTMKAIEHFRDQVLILRAQVGDVEATSELVRKYDRLLRVFVRGMLADDTTVDDVLQEVWVTVFRNLGGLRSPAAFKTWLLKVARNAVFLELRHRQQWSRLSGKELEECTSQESLNPIEPSRIWAALSLLAPEHREVLVLRHFHEMNYADIASTIGTPIGTVRSRLHYAHTSLRRVLGEKL